MSSSVNNSLTRSGSHTETTSPNPNTLTVRGEPSRMPRRTQGSMNHNMAIVCTTDGQPVPGGRPGSRSDLLPGWDAVTPCTAKLGCSRTRLSASSESVIAATDVCDRSNHTRTL